MWPHARPTSTRINRIGMFIFPERQARPREGSVAVYFLGGSRHFRHSTRGSYVSCHLILTWGGSVLLRENQKDQEVSTPRSPRERPAKVIANR